MKTTGILVLIVTIASSCNQTKPGDNVETSEYQLVWADEFNDDGPPDPEKWTYETGFVRNQELQWYQPANAFCEKGVLVIEGRRDSLENPGYQKGSASWKENRKTVSYTSASVTTKGLYDWKYGILEVKAKIEAEPGLWPAIWTLGIEKPWPHNGEIDLMEYYQGMILANFAWGDTLPYKPVWDDFKKQVSDFPEDWAEHFHVWKMDWTADNIKLYVDDMLLNEIDLSTTTNRDGSEFNPFHQSHYLLLNLAIGGTQGGDPSSTEFPARYLVDYVRIYQKRDPEKH